jgi:hypothetical protein
MDSQNLKGRYLKHQRYDFSGPTEAQSAAEAAGFESDFDSLLPELDFDSEELESELFSLPPSEEPLPPPRFVP